MVSTLAAIGAFLSLFLLLVLGSKRPRRPADSWLAAWLLAQMLFCGSIAAAGRAAPAAALILLGVGQLALLTCGPTQYLYAAAALGAPPRSWWKAATMVWAMLFIFLALILRPTAESAALVIRQGSIWLLLLPLSALLIAACYPAAVLRLVRIRDAQLKNELSALEDSDPQWIRLWALATMMLLAGLALATIGSLFSGWPISFHMSVVLALEVASIAFVGQRGLTRPGIFLAAVPGPVAARATSPANLDEIRGDYYALETLFATDKPYLRADLTAQMLSDRLGWAPERLTAALRHGGNRSFFDAVNAARVEEVQRLARDPLYARASLLALAHDAGFGSKSAFYEAFRRHAGCRPAEWRGRNLIRDA